MREVYTLEKANNKYLPVFQSATKETEISGYHTWHNKEDLLTNLSLYKAHLKRNYNNIIKTGYPLLPFKKDSWLDSNFTITLPDKVPANIYGRYISYEEYEDFIEIQYRAHTSVWDEYKYIYAWSEKCPLSDFNSIIDAFHTETNAEEFIAELEQNKVVSFDKAEPASFLSQDETEKCIELRNKFLDFKLKILSLYIPVLAGEEKSASLLPKTIEILTEGFTINEISFILDIEQKYKDSGFDRYLQFLYGYNNSILKFKDYSEPEGIYNNLLVEANDNSFSLGFFSTAIGGLHALIRSLGVVEHEVYYGPVMTQIRSNKIEALKNSNISKETALQNMAQTEQEYAIAEKEHWIKFKTILETSLERYGEQELTLNLSLKNEYIDEFLPILEDLLKTQAEYINKTGKVILSQQLNKKKKVVEEKKVDNYKFIPKGDYFEVRYDGGPENYISALKGVKYIHSLLNRPNILVGIEELYYAVFDPAKQNLPSLSNSLSFSESGSFHEPSNYDIGSSNQMIYDQRAINEIQDGIALLKAQIKNCTNPEEIIEKKEELEQLQFYLKTGNSQYSQFNDQQIENMRISIMKAIQTAIDKINKYDSKLAVYLKDKIQTGKQCMYKKELNDGITWKLS